MTGEGILWLYGGEREKGRMQRGWDNSSPDGARDYTTPLPYTCTQQNHTALLLLIKYTGANVMLGVNEVGNPVLYMKSVTEQRG